MEDYRAKLEEMLSFFMTERDKYNIELHAGPSGSLGSVNRDGKMQYIWRVDSKRRGINKNPEMIRRLARKEYVSKVIEEIDANINALTRAIREYRDINPKEIIENMRRSYASLNPEMFMQSQGTGRLRENLFMTEDEELAARLEAHKKWSEQPYEKNDYPFGEFAQWTSRGLHVRSQKEQVICEILYQYEIPFRYDQIIHIGNNKIAPDFTFQQRTGEELYLEYCGMMDKPEYVQKHLKKRSLYEKAGICEWDNMIYIFTKGKQLNTQLVDSIIKYQILPRM